MNYCNVVVNYCNVVVNYYNVVVNYCNVVMNFIHLTTLPAERVSVLQRGFSGVWLLV
jgi:hypothetical protein